MILISWIGILSTIYRSSITRTFLMDGRRWLHYRSSKLFQCDFNKRNCVVKSPRGDVKAWIESKISEPKCLSLASMNERRLKKFFWYSSRIEVECSCFKIVICDRIRRRLRFDENWIGEASRNEFKFIQNKCVLTSILWIMSFSRMFDYPTTVVESIYYARWRRFALWLTHFDSRYQSRSLFDWHKITKISKF